MQLIAGRTAQEYNQRKGRQGGKFKSFNRFAPFKTFYKRIPKHWDVIEANKISRARLFY
jgi:hypothetical protein